jgi:hypothetical protein
MLHGNLSRFWARLRQAGIDAGGVFFWVGRREIFSGLPDMIVLFPIAAGCRQPSTLSKMYASEIF